MMPKVQDEASPEIAQAIQALLRAEEQVCLQARTARPSTTNFSENFGYVVRGYEDAQSKLAALYTVGDADAQFARHKFDPLLQQARVTAPARAESGMRRVSTEEYDRQRREWAAAQEFQTRQQAEHDAAVSRWRERAQGEKTARLGKVGAAADLLETGRSPEQLQQTVQAWHATYTGKVAPVRAALASYLSVRQGPDDEVRPACQELLNATAALLADRAALEAPDLVAGRALKRAYGSLREGAQSCSTGYTAQATFQLSDYTKALREAEAALRPYGVAP